MFDYSPFSSGLGSILVTCSGMSGILKKCVFVSTKNGLNWCKHAQRSFFRTFYCSIEHGQKRLRSSSFSEPNECGTVQFRRLNFVFELRTVCEPFSNIAHPERCDRQFRWSALPVMRIRSYMKYTLSPLLF